MPTINLDGNGAQPPTLPPIDIGILRHKASALFHLCPDLPVHFTANGIATADQSTAMLTLRLLPDDQTVEETWHVR
jgi:hypothetical protein